MSIAISPASAARLQIYPPEQAELHCVPWAIKNIYIQARKEHMVFAF